MNLADDNRVGFIVGIFLEGLFGRRVAFRVGIGSTVFVSPLPLPRHFSNLLFCFWWEWILMKRDFIENEILKKIKTLIDWERKKRKKLKPKIAFGAQISLQSKSHTLLWVSSLHSLPSNFSFSFFSLHLFNENNLDTPFFLLSEFKIIVLVFNKTIIAQIIIATTENFTFLLHNNNY